MTDETGESGLLTEVRWEWDGTATAADLAPGATSVTVENATTLSADTEVWIGESGPYTVTAVDEETDTITFGPPFAPDDGLTADEGEPVVPDAGGGPGQVWVAEVVLVDADTPVEIPLTVHDLAVMPEGAYDPPKAVIVASDYSRIIDTPGSTPVVSGQWIPPETLVLPPGVGSDGLPPAASPPMSLVPLYSTFLARWPEQPNADLVGYEVWLDAPDITAGQVATVYGTTSQITAEPDGSPLRKGVNYTAWVLAFDVDGPAPAVGLSDTAQLSTIVPGDIEQAILDQIDQATQDAADASAAAAQASQDASDAEAAAAQAAADALAAAGLANDASDLAATKGKVIIQSAAPDAADELPQNLWIDTTNGANTPKRWNGATWEAVTDKTATDAAAAAAAAAQTASDAAADAAQALSDAQAAAVTAGQALTAANGKNTIWYQPTTPPGSAHAVNDVWFDTSDGYTPHEWDGDSWEPRPWGHQSIATVDAGKITVGFLAAARIAAQSIGVQHLAVGDVTNLWPDPLFNIREDDNGNPTARMSNAVVSASPAPPLGGNVILLADRDHVSVDSVTARPGDEFLIEVTYRRQAGTAPLVPGLWQRKANGTDTSSVPPWDNGTREVIGEDDLGGGWFRLQTVVEANPDATDLARVSLWLQIDQPAGGSGGTTYAVTDVNWRRRGTGSLLVDGAVSASKVGADVMVTNDLFSREGYFGGIDADQINTGNLEAALAIIGGLSVGSAITLDPENGLRIETPAGVTQFAADGSESRIAGEVVASAMTILGNLGLQGTTNEITKGSALELATGVTAPKTAPSLSSYWPSPAIHEGFQPRGFTRHVGRTIAGLPVLYSTESVPGAAVIQTHRLNNDGTFTLDFNFDLMSLRSEIESAIGGIVADGNNIYVLCQTEELIPGTYDRRFYVYRLNWNGSTFTYQNRWLYEPSTFLGGNSQYFPSIGWAHDTGSLIIGQAGGGGGRMWVTEYQTNGTYVQRHDLNQSNGSNWDPTTDIRMIGRGQYDYSGVRYVCVAANESKARVFATTSNENTGEGWSLPQSGIVGGFWDTADLRFRTRGATNAYLHSNIMNTTISAVFTWRRADGVGPDFAAYETDKSPRATMTSFPRRGHIALSTPTIPEDINDPTSPNAVTFYLSNLSNPGNADYKRQTPPAVGVNTQNLSTLVLTGGSPPASPNFPESTPAVITSDATDGDGNLIRLAGSGEFRLGAISGSASGVVTADPTKTSGFVPVGSIMMYGGDGIPAGWLRCDGSQFSSVTYPALAAVLGSTHGAISGSLYRLPDLRRRFPFGAYGSSGDSASGANDGLPIGSSRTPAHDHNASNLSTGAPSTSPMNSWSTPNTGSNLVPRLPQVDSHTHNVSGTTGNAHSLSSANPDRQFPYLAVHFIIKAI